MKTKGMAHQIAGLNAMIGREYFALFCDMGTGKSWMALADAERLYKAGEIDSLLIIAPRGVHTNFARREIPTHLEVPYTSAYWLSGASKRHLATIERLYQDDAKGTLRIFAVNIDAVNFDTGHAAVMRFLRSGKAMILVDESSRIKSPDSGRTKKVLALARWAKYRRIASGTPITNSPIDVFSQFEFLSSGLLGTPSYRAFVAEYAQLLPPGHHLMRHIAQRGGHGTPQVVAKDAAGRPIWRNLDKLQRMISPHAFRVTKAECLDLPPKVYEQRYYELTASQRRAYTRASDELRIDLNGEVITLEALGALMKLQQIAAGFVMLDGAAHVLEVENNPRLDTFMDVVEEVEGQFIVWARFKEELRQIAELLRKAGMEVVEYNGSVNAAMREQAVDDFQSGRARAFVGQPQSGGIGLTLTAANTVIYYSNDFNLETRLQSEDRAHRIGTKRTVVYIDLVATDTIDEAITRALQRKEEVASAILDNL
jgi:SNF2 family DNA or RNA helicase